METRFASVASVIRALELRIQDFNLYRYNRNDEANKAVIYSIGEYYDSLSDDYKRALHADPHWADNHGLISMAFEYYLEKKDERKQEIAVMEQKNQLEQSHKMEIAIKQKELMLNQLDREEKWWEGKCPVCRREGKICFMCQKETSRDWMKYIMWIFGFLVIAWVGYEVVTAITAAIWKMMLINKVEGTSKEIIDIFRQWLLG